MQFRSILSQKLSTSTDLGIRPRGLIVAFYMILASAWFIAVLLRLTVRDLTSFNLLTAFHYATPMPLLLLLASFLAATALFLRHSKACAGWCLMAIVIAQSAGSHPLHHQPINTIEKSAQQRLMLWNVCHGRHGFDNVVHEMQSHNADIYMLIEAGPPTEQMRSFWQENFPKHEITLLGSEMVLLLRGTAGHVHVGALRPQGQYRQVEVTTTAGTFDLIFVDIHGRPTLSRREPIARLTELIDESTDHPLIVAGDFNTPRDSPLFQPLDARLSNAYDAAGTGFEPTWPWPLPLLTLDQVWSNSGIRFHHCQQSWCSTSDHRPVVVDFSLTEQQMKLVNNP